MIWAGQLDQKISRGPFQQELWAELSKMTGTSGYVFHPMVQEM